VAVEGAEIPPPQRCLRHIQLNRDETRPALERGRELFARGQPHHEPSLPRLPPAVSSRMRASCRALPPRSFPRFIAFHGQDEPAKVRNGYPSSRICRPASQLNRSWHARDQASARASGSKSGVFRTGIQFTRPAPRLNVEDPTIGKSRARSKS